MSFTKTFFNALANKAARKRLLITLGVLLLFRIGSSITVPGINVEAISNLQDIPFLNMMSLISGNGLKNFSIFAMGVSPYVTASIIVQMLSKDIYQPFVNYGRQGDVGKRKLTVATKAIALAVAFVQSIAIVAGFNTLASMHIVDAPNRMTYLTIGLIMSAGSMFTVWLSDVITEKGFGNGMSMIIFSGIVSGFPQMIKSLIEDFFINVKSGAILGNSLISSMIVLVLVVLIIFGIYMQLADYRIPIQATKSADESPDDLYLPLKPNPAGVIPVIFASTVLTLPGSLIPYINQFIGSYSWLDWLGENLSYSSGIGLMIYAILILGFSYFYTFMQIDPEDTAESLQKQSAYIKGVRPGRDTEWYLKKRLRLLALMGGGFLVIVSILPMLGQSIFKLDSSISLSGTSLLILISTGVEFIKSIDGYLLKRYYVERGGNG